MHVLVHMHADILHWHVQWAVYEYTLAYMCTHILCTCCIILAIPPHHSSSSSAEADQGGRAPEILQEGEADENVFSGKLHPPSTCTYLVTHWSTVPSPRTCTYLITYWLYPLLLYPSLSSSMTSSSTASPTLLASPTRWSWGSLWTAWECSLSTTRTWSMDSR